jgi:hypothetical protein
MAYTHHKMFPKMSFHDRELHTKYRMSTNELVSFRFDHFDRRYGVDYTVGRGHQRASGVSAMERLICKKYNYVDYECEYVAKAT